MKAIFCCFVAAALVGCGGNSTEEPQALAAPSASQQKATTDMKSSRDKFAFSLKDQLLKEHPQENLCYSPLSIQLCLSLLLNGTAGDSSDQLRTTLALGKEPLQTVNDGNYTLVAALLGDSFTCANSIWLPREVEAKPAFRTAINESYRGAFFTVKDFGPNTVKQINDWTSENTKGRIPELFKTFDPLTSVVLVNALTFDGKWAFPFDRSATKPEPFKLQDGKSVDVPTMHQVRHLACGESGGVKVLRMDYVGDNFSMMFILPPAGQSASTYLSKLTDADFRKALSSASEREIDVALPKFELRANYSLNKTLSAMGMAPLFAHTDLSGISDLLKEQTNISQVVHQTYMKVYEEGTEAAAATGAAAATASEPSEPATFHADRPFVYALVHKATGAIVFLGVVADPRG